MDENPKKPHDHTQQIPGQFQQRSITTPTGHAPGYKPRWVQSLPPQGQPMDMVWDSSENKLCVWNGNEWVCSGEGGSCYTYTVCRLGCGSHLTLFGANGALAAAWARPFDAVNNSWEVSIWVCPEHYEEVDTPFDFGTGPVSFTFLSIESPLTNEHYGGIAPQFTAINSIPAFFNMSVNPASAVLDHMDMRNLLFTGTFDPAFSLFAGKFNWAKNEHFDHCGFLFFSNVWGAERVARGGKHELHHCSFIGWDDGYVINTSQPGIVGFHPFFYRDGFYFRDCSFEGFNSFIGGIGLNASWCPNLVFDDCHILADSAATGGLPWLNLIDGEGLETGSAGHIHVRLIGNHVEEFIINGGVYTAPFLKVDQATTDQLGSLIVEMNIVEISSAIPAMAPSQVCFADIGGAAPPTRIRIVDNIIRMTGTSVPTGVAINVAAGVTNIAVDNTYEGFATNVGGAGASGATVGTFHNHTHASSGYEGGTVDAGVILYTPAVLTDWNGSADPGDVNDALDQIASRVTVDVTNLSAHLADPSDAHDAGSISIVDAGGFFLGVDVEAALQELGAGGGGGGHTIHDEVAAGLTARTDLHFMGNGVVVLDNAASTRTEVIIPTVYDAVVDPDDTNAVGKGNVYAKIQDAITAGHKSILVRGVATDAAAITIAGGDAVQVLVGDSTLKAVVPKDLQCQKADVLLSNLTFATDTTLATATKLLITGARVTVFACLFAGALAAGSAAVNNGAGLNTTTTSVDYDTGVDFLTRTGLGPVKIDDEIFYVLSGGAAASGTLTVTSRSGSNAHYTLNTIHADNAVITDMTAAAITIAAADVTVIQCRFIALTHNTTGGLKKHGQAILVCKDGSRARIVSNVFLANTLFALISGWPENAATNTFEPKGVQVVSNTANANSCVGPLIQLWPNTVGDTGGREVTAWNITGNTLIQGEAGFIWVHHRGTVIAGNLFDGVTRFNKTMLINKVGGIAAGDTTIPYDTVAGSGTLGTDWGIVEIDSEIIIYGSSDASNLYNCIRGVFGTTAATHADNATINLTTQLGLLNTKNNATATSAYVLASGNVFMTMKIPLYSDNGFNLVRLTLADNVFFSSTTGSSTIYGGTLTAFLNNVWGNGNTLDFMGMSTQTLFGGSGNLTVRNPNADTAIFFPVGSLTGVATPWGLPAGENFGLGRIAGDNGTVAKPYTNRTGAATVLGHVVIADVANANSFVTVAAAGSERVIGVVVQGSVANLSDALIGVAGATDVLCNGTIAIGDYLKTSATAGEATTDGGAKTLKSFAIATEARAGAGSSLVHAVLL